ncbi:hypothetical protein [Kribbella sp. NPDC055071]
MTHPAPPRRSGVHPAIIVSIILAVLLLGTAGAGIAGIAIEGSQRNTQQKRADDLQQKLDAAGPGAAVQKDILAAAQTDVTTLFSYDYRKLDDYAAAAKTVTTDTFGVEFAKTVAAIHPQQLAQQAVAKAAVTDAAVKDATADSAHVLMFVDTTTTTKTSKTPSVQRTRVELTLKLAGGRWLVDGVDAV